MVARITTPYSIQRALNYNEQKIKKGQAELLHAANYLKDAEQLNFYDKLKRFTDLINLNERAKTNTLHISLNFHNSDMLSKEKIIEIGVEYMDKIGFGEQPFLIYQHHDAGHPHLHIVTTNIQVDGKRIDTFNIGRNQSEKARQELEQKFKLVQAKGRRILNEEIRPAECRIHYGKSETKRAISNVLAHVLNNYKYSSLAELNAVLKLYNVIADRGSEDSRIYKNNGLVYRVLDANGNKIGVPIKSSLICNKPGLKFLEEKYPLNDTAKQQHKQRVKNAINLAFMHKSNFSMKELIRALSKEQVQVVLRQSKEGFLYGITYIDFKTRCVFNGSDLGKEYSAKGLIERCNKQSEKPAMQMTSLSQEIGEDRFEHSETLQQGILKTIDELMKPEINQNANEPFEQRQFKKKKKLRQRL
jgi:hypothetical protein